MADRRSGSSSRRGTSVAGGAALGVRMGGAIHGAQSSPPFQIPL
jgi:hypothetical protein